MGMTIEEIKRRKAQRGLTNEQMAKLSGLPLTTVQKVLGGTTKSPRYKTVSALAAVFENDEEEERAAIYKPGGVPPLILRDASGPAYAVQPDGRKKTSENMKYPRQGSYTLEDYLALPNDQRVELIDGVFYDMSSPSIPHQLIGGDIYAVLKDYIKGRKGGCMTFTAPTDVQIDKDNRTIVQPDVMIVCDRSKIRYARIFGAPDFIVEVLSPSTRSKDILIKSAKYKSAGVKEYWMVDLKAKSVTKTLFGAPDKEDPDGDIRIETFPFEKPVPVSLFDGEISVNFAELMEEYAFIENNRFSEQNDSLTDD